MTTIWVPAFAGMTATWVPAFAGMTTTWVPAFAGMTTAWAFNASGRMILHRCIVVIAIICVASCDVHDNSKLSQSPVDLAPPDSAVNPIVVHVDDVVADTS